MNQEEYMKIQPSFELLKKLFPSLHPPCYDLWKIKGNFDQIEREKYDSISSLLKESGITNEGEIFPLCTIVLYMEARLQMISHSEEKGKSGIMEILFKFNEYLENHNIKELIFRGEEKDTGFSASFKIDNEAIIKLFINSVLIEFDTHEIQYSPVNESLEDHIKTIGKHIFTFKGIHILSSNEKRKRKRGRQSSLIVNLQRELKTALERYINENLSIQKPGEESCFIGNLFSIAGLIESKSEYEALMNKSKESYTSYHDFLRRRIDRL